MSPAPSVRDVDDIVQTADPVLRNLRITLGYHDLACALAARLGPGANWFAFATWASKQAGQTIRGEDAWRLVERELLLAPAFTDALRGVVEAGRALGSRLGLDELRRTLAAELDLEAALRRAADAVARGNAMVFGDVGRTAASFLAECADDGTAQAGLARFDATLRDGEPPEGQSWLRRAFHRYLQLISEAQAAQRAQCLLLADLEIGYHEQLRLQPEILAAANAALPEAEVVRQRLLARLFPGGHFWLRARQGFWGLIGRPAPLDRALDRLIEAARTETRAILTRRVMTLDLAGEATLGLGSDITGAWPESLRVLADPELKALLLRIDPTPDSLTGTGARDWGALDQRLHFIADLFRRHQETQALFRPPFTAEQMTAIRSGRHPAGRL